MPAGTYDIEADQYATFSLGLVWQDADGRPIDLTGYHALMQVRDQAGALVVELSDADGRIALGGTAGSIELQIAAADMAALPAAPAAGAEAWQYDLLLTAPPAPPAAAVVTRLLAGSFTVNPGTSQPAA